MGKMLYIDCFCGISGDMMLGALLDLGFEGLDIDFLKKELKKIDVTGYALKLIKEKRGPIYASRLEVKVKEGQPLRNFDSIKGLINESRLKNSIKETGIKIFSEIAEAESFVHQKPAGQVHFHEVGALDSIIDIMLTAIAVDFLNPKKIFCSKIPLGSGTADTMHGKIPVPAPATVHILKGLPVFGGDYDFEVTTPTGAAIVKVLVDCFSSIPDMEITCTGNGTGTHQNASKNAPPNILRLFFGKTLDHKQRFCGSNRIQDKLLEYAETKGCEPASELIILSANIDDMSGELFGHVLNKLLALDVPDAWVEPIYMKKNRLAGKLCVLCREEQIEMALDTIFSQTTTFGIRAEIITRIALKRDFKTINLPYGEVTVKVAVLDNDEVTYSPEYSSCARLAEKTGKPLKEIYRDLMFFLSSR